MKNEKIAALHLPSATPLSAQPSFGTTPLSASKIKRPPPNINDFTYTELNQINRNP
jgi:hypothetical protein